MFFNQVINVHGFHEVRQMVIETAELFVSENSLVELEIAIGNLKRYNSPGNDQIPGELITAGVKHILRYTDLFFPHEITPQQWKEFINLPIYKKGNE
jgi:hypothetical protein